jgi:glycosyltransferase involved in cell wall biosynthesis
MPTFNEIENLEWAVGQINLFAPEVQILIVDDSSPDGTGVLADKLAENLANVNVLHRDQKDGLGAAYLAGFSWAISKGFEYVVEMDADGSHRAVDLPKLLARASKADLVIGSRWISGGEVENWPWCKVHVANRNQRHDCRIQSIQSQFPEAITPRWSSCQRLCLPS